MGRFVLWNATRKKTWGMYATVEDARSAARSLVAEGEEWVISSMPAHVGSGKIADEGIGPPPADQDKTTDGAGSQ